MEPISFDKLKVGEILVIVAACVGLAKSNGIIAASGDFVSQPVSAWAKYAGDVLALLKEQNVAIPANVDKIVAAAPMLLSVFGIK